MNAGEEVDSLRSTGQTPSPVDAAPGERPPCALARPTADAVLRWIAAAAPKPWFPSSHAKHAGVTRDSLDDPLNELRLGGLVRIASWERGAGQGYVLTPEGEAAAASPAALGLLRDLSPPPADRPDEEPAEPNPEFAARSQVIDLRPPIVTPVLLAANVLWFFVGLVMALRMGVPLGTYLASGDTMVLLRQGAVSAPDLMRGEWWRLATSCFVHVGALHLIANMFVLGMLGPLAELIWGRWRLGVVYVISGLAGSCLAMTLHPVDERGVSVLLAGASGAIWGVQTSLLAWLILFRAYLPSELSTDWFRRIGLMFLINIALSFLPGISWEAHLGGGIAGFVAAGLLNALRFGERARRWLAAVLLLMLPGLCLGTLIAAKTWSDDWAPLRHRAAAEAYNRLVVPAVDAIRPEIALPIEERAVWLLIKTPNRRAEQMPGVRAEVEQFHAACAAATNQLPGPPTGSPLVDRLRTKCAVYATAREKAMALLLAMLDRNEIPTEAAWKEWAAARDNADHLWVELVQR